VKSNGRVLVVTGLTVPVPLVVSDTLVALPPNVLPLTFRDVLPQTVPLLLLKVIVGGFEHPHETRKSEPVVIQPEEFLTEMV